MPLKFNPFSGNFDFAPGVGGTVFDGEVNVFSDLPETVSNPPVNSAYLVRNTEGTIWFGNRKQKGIYIRSGNSGVRNDDWTYGGDYPVTSVNGQTGAVTVQAAQVVSSPAINGDTVLTAGRNQLLYLTAIGGTSANVTLPFSNNQNGDTITLVANFTGSGSTGTLTIRAAGQMSGGNPLSYTTLYTLVSNGEAVTFVSDGSNGFGGWRIVSVGGSFPATNNAVQEYNVNGVLLPNGDSGSGVQLTRNTATPQAPDGSDRTFNAEQLIYRRIGSTAQRLDTYLGVKLEWQPVPPTTPTTTGSTGQIAYADPYFYICVGVNTWRRAPVAAW